MSEDDKTPCEDALDLLWQEIILKNNPDYGDWEYPGQAYRHIKAEYDDVVKQRDNLFAALKSFLILDQLGGMMPSTKTIVKTVVENAREWIEKAGPK